MSTSGTGQIGAVERAVVSETFEGREVRVLVIAQTYPTQVADLWEAITDADRLPRWFAPVSGDLVLGGRFQVEGNAGGEVRACAPPTSFEISWEYGDQVSWVQVGLIDGPDGTTLELRHLAPVDGPAEEFWDQFGPGAVGVGWDLGLLGLSSHLAGGGVTPENATAWSASEEGRAFVSAVSDAWAEASIAFGTDPDAARAAAERTTAFYTPAG